jgi:hypothetical protein
MYHKYKLILISAIALSVFGFVIVLSQIGGIPVEDVIVGIGVYVLYGVLILGYLLRFALIFIGVFAIFRALQIRHYKQMEV